MSNNIFKGGELCVNPAKSLSDKLLESACRLKATDIHFYPITGETKVFFRIHGQRIYYQSIPLKQYELLLTYYKFTSGMDIGETRKPQNGMLPYQTQLQNYSLRLSTLPVNHTESLAIRILPQDDVSSLNELFLFPSQLKQLKQWFHNSSGLILFTGPTGVGKTTTLYAILKSIIKEGRFQTITLEDPIEKNLQGILQVQINEKAGISYHVGLKAALRHDPDIIMVGEIRDAYTAEFAFDASLTGHLVLSTMHAHDTIGTLYRLLEMGLNKTDLSQTLIGVASLQLLHVDINKQINRRFAIMEMLTKEQIMLTLQGREHEAKKTIYTFHRLRKKAYAYGFIKKEDF